jgi:hypothetical protein
MTTINWLMLFKEIIAVYCDNHTKPINTLCGQNEELQIVTTGGTYRYHRPFVILEEEDIYNSEISM